MTFKSATAIIVFSFIVGFAACYFFVKKDEVKPIKIPEAKEVVLSSLGLKLPKFNPAPLFPYQTIRFIPAGRDTVYRVDTVFVPKYYPDTYWLTRSNPVSQQGNTLSFRYYDPVDKMEKINKYEIQPKGLRWAIYADVFQPVDQFFVPLGEMDPTLGARFNLSYRSVGFNVGTYVTPSLNEVRAVAGFSVKLAGN